MSVSASSSSSSTRTFVYTSTVDIYRSYSQLRFSSTVYKIPILGIHICDKNTCGMMLLSEPFHIGANPEYKNGHCKLSNTTFESMIQLSVFDSLIPHVYDDSPLYNPDVVVIPHNEFSVCIDFPLGNPVDINVRKSNDVSHLSYNGYTMRELIQVIKNLYLSIYETERETTTEQTIELKRECNCVTDASNSNMSVLQSDTTPSQDTLEERCGICYSEFNDDYYTLQCNHVFHKTCIESWMHTGNGTSCPFCRNIICYCDDCGNTKLMQYVWRGKVLPYSHRTNFYRNMTNGTYKIYNHDFEMLILKSLYYNQKLKRLRIGVCRNVMI